MALFVWLAQGVGAHSDQLTTLGPLPIIASLSLGAQRTFRLTPQPDLSPLGAALLLRPQQRQQQAGWQGAGSGRPPHQVGKGTPGGAPGATALAHATIPQLLRASGGSAARAAAAAAAAGITRIDVPLPHNTLLVMFPPVQECWRHEVCIAPSCVLYRFVRAACTGEAWAARRAACTWLLLANK